jgi:hypothetical protein
MTRDGGAAPGDEAPEDAHWRRNLAVCVFATRAALKNVAPKAMPDHCTMAAWSLTPSSST